MPIYEYQCRNCQTIFEVRATFKEKELGLNPECPQCHSQDTRQRLSSGLFLRVGGETSPLGLSVCGPNTRSGCCG